MLQSLISISALQCSAIHPLISSVVAPPAALSAMKFPIMSWSHSSIFFFFSAWALTCLMAGCTPASFIPICARIAAGSTPLFVRLESVFIDAWLSVWICSRFPVALPKALAMTIDPSSAGYTLFGVYLPMSVSLIIRIRSSLQSSPGDMKTSAPPDLTFSSLRPNALRNAIVSSLKLPSV